MTYKKLILPIIAIALMHTACKKVLNVNPVDSIDASTALNTPQDVNAAVIGCYGLMVNGALYGTDLFLMPDLLSADPNAPDGSADRYITWTGTFNGPREIYNKRMVRNNNNASRIWIAAYQVINMANRVLNALNVVTDPADRAQYEGEALFIRGILHFELVRIYGLPWGATPTNNHLGVVIKTTPTLTEADAAQRIPRSTVAEVYNRVITDLTNAAAKLPETNDRRATKYTALAFLSRVYLQQGDYAKALNTANQVINSGFYRLNGSVSTVFSNKNTAESIWEIQQNDQNNTGTFNNVGLTNDGMAAFYASFPGIGRADVQIQNDFIDLYPIGDLRRNEWYYIGTGLKPGSTYCGKWKSYSQNLPVIRIAEMYLTRAECNLRLSSAVGATPAADLAAVRNTARTNSTAPAIPVLADILKERMLETAFEGLRIHDIKRLRLSVGTLPWNDNKLVFPIPQREVDATQGVIVQNPGY